MNSQKKKDTGDAIVRKPLAIVEVQEVLRQWYDLQYNEVKHVVEGRKKGEGCFNEMKDNNLLIQLLSNGYRISQSTLKALLNSDFVPSFNPILKYFGSLPPWDEGNRDYITELANHVKAIDQQQFNHHFKKMMVRTVACAVDDHLYNNAVFPSGLEQTEVITLLCPTNERISLPVTTSHSLMVFSYDPDRIYFTSGLKQIELTEGEFPVLIIVRTSS